MNHVDAGWGGTGMTSVRGPGNFNGSPFRVPFQLHFLIQEPYWTNTLEDEDKKVGIFILGTTLRPLTLRCV